MNDIQKFFNQGGAFQLEEDKKEILDSIKDCNPYYCLGCQEFCILDRGKRFQCQLCGCETECMDMDEFNKFRIKMRRGLMVSIPKKKYCHLL